MISTGLPHCLLFVNDRLKFLSGPIHLLWGVSAYFLLMITLPTLQLLYYRQALAIPLVACVPGHYQLRGHPFHLIVLLLKQCATFDCIPSEMRWEKYRIRKCLQVPCPLYFIYY